MEVQVFFEATMGGKMAARINLPGGMLKIKRYIELRSVERAREVPVLKVGIWYFIWWRREDRSR
ncbi:hypothetical protein [Aquibium sp. ELW1220]|uniref:hypothetical protein n=1 Tax=Aquibium sp. ELW1220 TaxID=2976766 RepID=UPI0025B23785|nr:hypothetical protein [Aquibium sp. ELW1220]MDN2583347.1 hypothetical protein [Aquibium sp. ELW1220]